MVIEKTQQVRSSYHTDLKLAFQQGLLPLELEKLVPALLDTDLNLPIILRLSVQNSLVF